MAEYSEHIKAQALAALLAGQSFSQVASMFGVPIGTLKSWKSRDIAGVGRPVAPDASEKRARIGQLLLDYLEVTIETMKAQQGYFSDKEWVQKQSAAEIAVLHRTSADVAVRLLEGLADDTTHPGDDAAA